MITVLTGALPVAARGAAMASYLLSDGTGPLYDRHSPLGLAEAVREATRQMTARSPVPHPAELIGRSATGDPLIIEVPSPLASAGRGGSRSLRAAEGGPACAPRPGW